MAPALLFMFALLYLLPTVVALLRGIKTPQGPILLNILLGWTGLGWIGALIWPACRNARSITFLITAESSIISARTDPPSTSSGLTAVSADHRQP
jgi:Superinfection immunity protein